jgi:hypothetical protein
LQLRIEENALDDPSLERKLLRTNTEEIVMRFVETATVSFVALAAQMLVVATVLI